MTTSPEQLRRYRWAELQKALGHLHRAQFEYQRGDIEAGDTWMDDLRTCLGALALSLSDELDAEGNARLLSTILTPPPASEAGLNDE